jgi:hypothetical protein
MLFHLDISILSSLSCFPEQRSSGNDKRDDKGSSRRSEKDSSSTKRSEKESSKQLEAGAADTSNKEEEGEGNHTNPEKLEEEWRKSEEKKNSEIAKAEIQIGGLTTTQASDVEELLDQRNAQKKEEMKERNPDFFRNV